MPTLPTHVCSQIAVSGLALHALHLSSFYKRQVRSAITCIVAGWEFGALTKNATFPDTAKKACQEIQGVDSSLLTDRASQNALTTALRRAVGATGSVDEKALTMMGLASAGQSV